MALFIPAFYADDLGLPLAAVGAAIAASRLLDVLTDPLIGSLSDRIGTRWGRRKRWMVVGTPLFAVAPALMMAGGVLFLRGFPITRERHAEVRAALEARSRMA